MSKRQGAKLREARNQAGFDSAREAALSCGWPESSYRAHEGGWRNMGRDDAEKYIRKFKAIGGKKVSVTAEAVMFPDRAEGPRAEPTSDVESAYAEGWADAMAYVASTAKAPPPAKQKPPRKERA